MLTVSLNVICSFFLRLPLSHRVQNIKNWHSPSDGLVALPRFLGISAKSSRVPGPNHKHNKCKIMLNWTKLKTHFLQIANASLPDARDRCSRLIAHFFSLILLVLTSSLRILKQYSNFLYYHGSLKEIFPCTVKTFNQKSIKIVTNKFTTILSFSSFIGCKTVFLELHHPRKFLKKGFTTSFACLSKICRLLTASYCSLDSRAIFQPSVFCEFWESLCI